jgi:hypothetical protein
VRCYEVAGAQTPLVYIENGLFRPCLLVRVLKAVAPELNRDRVDYGAPAESRTSDDCEDLVRHSIWMARAVWKNFDRLKLFRLLGEFLRKLLSYYQDEMEPRYVNYLDGPPSDARTRSLAFEMLYDWVKENFPMMDRVEECAVLCNDPSLI